MPYATPKCDFLFEVFDLWKVSESESQFSFAASELCEGMKFEKFEYENKLRRLIWQAVDVWYDGWLIRCCEEILIVVWTAVENAGVKECWWIRVKRFFRRQVVGLLHLIHLPCDDVPLHNFPFSLFASLRVFVIEWNKFASLLRDLISSHFLILRGFLP